MGSGIKIGNAGFQVESPIERCAATNVNPESAERDLNIIRALQAGFRHIHMGVYAKVIAGGEIAKGDPLTLSD